MPPRPNPPGPLPPRINYAPPREINLYSLTEDELDRLAAGPPGSQLLSAAYALLPTSASFVIAVLGTEIPSARVFDVFVIVAAVTGIAGLVCLGLGLSNYKSNKALVARIKGQTTAPAAPDPPTPPAP